jgi:hypothetical protein
LDGRGEIWEELVVWEEDEVGECADALCRLAGVGLKLGEWKKAIAHRKRVEKGKCVFSARHWAVAGCQKRGSIL